jgi:SAM-dependent methyltransferase
MTTDAGGTESDEYAQRLERLEGAWWKRALDVQRPYRWNLRRLRPGFVLDVGCGIGRNLAHLDGHGVGVDHNPASVATCRARGFTAFTAEEFAGTDYARPGTFDALLCSHVVEHMAVAEARGLLADYLPFVSAAGRVILITPQERGFASDPTHVQFADFACLEALAAEMGLRVDSRRSFPFPRVVGKVFAYNEFVVVAHR